MSEDTEALTPRPAPLETFPEPGPSSALGLDSLLSPVLTDAEGPSTSALAAPEDDEDGVPEEVDLASTRDSFVDVGQDVDVDEDDVRFSNVPLTAHAAAASRGSLAGIAPTSPKSDRRSTIHLGSGERSSMASTHRRTGSAASTSSSTVPFILQRLDLAKDDASTKSRHNSLTNHALQQEFDKIHQDLQAEGQPVNIDWDFWGVVISDYQGFAAEYPEQLAKAIERGIPDTLRGMMWQLMAASKDPELEATYLRLLKETSPHEKAITRDLGRTFPNHEFFTDSGGIGQENLFNVLKAYSLYDEQVGFCQGLPFIVAILLLNMPDEEAFCLLVRLMHSYDIRGHFTPEMPKLQMRLFQFDRLVEDMLPVLHVHFLRQGIKSSMYTSQWYLTLFSYRFPMDIVYRIYDNILASGVEAIFAFSLVLLHKNESALLALKFDEILSFLNGRVFEAYEKATRDDTSEDTKVSGAAKAHDVDTFVADAAALRITPFMLDAYAREYEDMVRARDAQATEMDALRGSNRALSAQVKTLEGSLATLNAEHVELLNELVRARLKNEETEGELVRYKLLYAEAMHQNEDANSNNTRLSNAFSFMTGKRGSNG